MQLDQTEVQKAKVLLLTGDKDQFFHTAKAVGMVPADLPETDEHYALLKTVVQTLSGIFNTLNDALSKTLTPFEAEQLADGIALRENITSDEIPKHLVALNQQIRKCLKDFSERYRNRDDTAVSLKEVLQPIHLAHPDFSGYIDRVGELMSRGRWPLALV